MKGLVRKNIWVIFILILFTFWVGRVSAEESAPEESWSFEIGLYFWGASIGGESASGSDIDVGFSDIFDSLEFAAMGLASVRWNKWSLSTDVIYLDLEKSATVAPSVVANVGLSGWVVTPFVGYNLADTERINLDILGGARYLDLDANLSVGPLRAEDSGGNWDGIIGIRGGVKLTKKWFLPYHLDIGKGGSNVTWQAFGGVGYRFKWFDLVGAYRYLRWDFDDNKAFDDLYFHGPLFGIKFRF